MRDEVTGPQASVVGGAAVFNTLRQSPFLDLLQMYPRQGGPRGHEASTTHPNHVVHSVDVAVAHVDPDGAQREAVLLSRAVDDHGGAQASDAQGQVPARGGVAGRGVRGERVRRDGAGLQAATGIVCAEALRVNRQRSRSLNIFHN